MIAESQGELQGERQASNGQVRCRMNFMIMVCTAAIFVVVALGIYLNLDSGLVR